MGLGPGHSPHRTGTSHRTLWDTGPHRSQSQRTGTGPAKQSINDSLNNAFTQMFEI